MADKKIAENVEALKKWNKLVKRRGRKAELRQLINTAKNTAHNARCVRF